MVTFLYGGDRNESGNIIQEKPVMHPEIPGSKKCVGAVSTRMTPLKMGKELRVYICNLCFGIAGLSHETMNGREKQMTVSNFQIRQRLIVLLH